VSPVLQNVYAALGGGLLCACLGNVNGWRFEVGKQTGETNTKPHATRRG